MMRGRGFAAIGLFNPKTDHNVGGVMRAAFCYSASLIVIQGHRYRRQASDTTDARRHIPTLHVADLLGALPHDCVPVAVEIDPSARSLFRYRHPERAFYIFGPEDGSLPRHLTERCRDLISIPTAACMNLAATANVVLYDRMAKQ
ncbi:MAG TPA: RNA methyltransferase [Dongiaceae bacterium]|nr:RNA methyltransferase [Dongiaceae bacterium]